MTEKQVALLVSAIGLVLMGMSASALMMVSMVRDDVVKLKADLAVEQAKLAVERGRVEKLVANQLAMAPLLDPDRRRPSNGGELETPSKDSAAPSHQESAAGSEATSTPQAQQVDAPNEPKAGASAQAPGAGAGTDSAPATAPTVEAATPPTPAPPMEPQTNAGVPSNETLLAALASPQSIPQIKSPSPTAVDLPATLAYAEQAPTVKAVTAAKTPEAVDAILVQQIISNWVRPPSARDGMGVEVVIRIDRNGLVKQAKVLKSSGDKAFDESATQAIMEVKEVPEIRNVSNSVYESLYKERRVVFTPEALSG